MHHRYSFDGVFQLDEELYTVKPASLYAAMLGDLNDPSQSQKLLASRYPLVVYKESDRAALAADDSSGRRVSSCGADELAPNQEFTTGNAHEHEHDLLGGLLRERRAAQGCPVSRKIL